MSKTDIVADALTMIRNASKIGKEALEVPNSRIVKAIIEILKNEGYIKNWRLLEDRKNNNLRIYLKYDINKQPAIRGLRRISKSGLRVYVNKTKIPIVLRGYGLAILSTSKGILTNRQARDLKVGGEVICYVW